MKLFNRALLALFACGMAHAQVGPDVSVSNVGGDVTNYGTSGGIRAYSLRTTSCNVGNETIDWMDDFNMPVIAQNLYRIVDGHIEQLGYSFLKDSFCAVSEFSCGPCQPTPCDNLGIGCADTYGSGLNDGRNGWAKWGVDANRGEWFSIPPGPTQDNNTIRGRLQVLDSKLGDPNAAYLIEGHYVSGHDQQAGLGQNNQSWRYVVGGGNLANIGGLKMFEPAIFAWKDTHADVKIEEANVVNEGGVGLYGGINGFMWLASRATDIGGGQWRYDYAVQNQTSERGVGSITIASGNDIGSVSNMQFFGIDHHSGSPYSDAPWTPSTTASTVTWATQTVQQNANANAIRWGNLVAFSFVSNAPPQQNGTVTLGLFETGSPSSLSISAWVPESTGPLAQFTGSPTSGVAPMAVSFTDLSTGGATSWDWSFGDGGTSTQQNPTHTYSSVGQYTVTLDISGPNGSDGETKPNYITTTVPPPVAEFFGDPTSGNSPLNVNFTDQSTGTATSWLWSFGDGGTSTAPNPSHTYQTSGAYTVSMTATGPGGSDTETKSSYINVSATPPTSEFTANTTNGNAPLAVGFTELASGEVTGYSWSFGDGGTSTQANPTHVYNSAGVYTVALTATGPAGSDTETKTDYITVTISAPVANFAGFPTNGNAPHQVIFGDTSVGEVTSWSWSFGDGGTSTLESPVHLYTTSGSFDVSLTVTGPGGSDTETKVDYVTINATPPTASFVGAPTAGSSPLLVAFTDNSVGEVTDWSWSFGDGGTSTQQNPLHTYTTAGLYTVELTVTGPGGSDTETIVDYITVDPGEIGTNYCSPNLPNSTGQSSSITATGSVIVSQNDVTVSASNLPLSEFGYFLASPTQGFISMPGGSAGNFCLGGGPQLGRYDDMVQNSGATGTFAIPIDLTAVPIAAMPGSTAIQPGDTWNFQGWHRDQGGSNFTDGVSILFQ